MESNQFDVVCFTDLDDTLFQTPRKMTEAELVHAAPGASDATGKVRSFMTQRQQMLVNWLLNTTTVIPVTARQSEQMARVHIPFTSYRVTTHGAVILTPDGEEMAEWKQHIQTSLEAVSDKLRELESTVQGILANPADHGLDGLDAWCRMNQEYDQDIYLVSKVTNSETAAMLADLERKVNEKCGLDTDPDFYIHRNGNNLAWIPSCITKKHAVTFLMEHEPSLKDKFAMGMGDSLSDLPFTGCCDFSAIPVGSQAWQQLSGDEQ